MPTKIMTRLLAGTAVSALLTGAAFAADANARPYDIPQQDTATALQAFAMQSGKQVLFPYEAVKGKQAPQIKGDYSDAEVLALLAGSAGLRVTADDGKTVTLRPQAAAAAEGGDDGTVQALIVTAQKREEDIQDVPIAISAFTQEDLTRSQVAGGPDLITQVPNMTFTKTNFSSYSVQLRGIGTQAISATTDPAVAVAFNNTPFIRNRFFEQEFYDMQRVEVLRGPQGTLYGRNATAGVVNLISQKPKFNFEARASADISNYSSSRIEGMVNIPLVEDAVALRVAGAWTKRDGYATNELTGNPIDGRDLWSTRVSLRVQPNDRISANLIWEHFQEDDDRLRSGKQLCHRHTVDTIGGFSNVVAAGGQGSGQTGNGGKQATFSQGCNRESLYSDHSFDTPNGEMLPYYVPLGSIGLPIALPEPYVNKFQSHDLRVIESTIDPTYRARADIGELQVNWDLTDNLTLTSETAYGTDWVYSLQDFNRFNTAPGAWRLGNGSDPYDPTDQPTQAFLLGILDENGVFCDPQLGCSDRMVAVDISTAEAWQFSQELRLASNYDGPFNFSLGANYLRADSKDKYYVFINSLSLVTALTGVEPYQAGVTDNQYCLANGPVPSHPDRSYEIANCVYIDPNPIGSVNDEGHNYFLSNNPYKLISYAVFGEAYYQLTDALKLTAGLRYTIDRKEAPRVPSQLYVSQSYGYPVAEVVEQEWREPTGRLTADWKPDLGFTDETMVYASYAHGYKAGGANPPGFVRVYYADQSKPAAVQQAAASETRPKTFDPEFVNAFELGTKNRLLGGALTLNLAGFYYDYKGYQISEIVDRSAFNRNFDATVWGVEVESDWRALENLRLGFKGGYESTRIADGERAIDLMDRTAGRADWLVVRPFPAFASSCVLPTYVFVGTNGIVNPSGVSGGRESPCELAYTSGLDPVTELPYVENPQVANTAFFSQYTNYPGFNPFDESQGHNGGEGFFKQLGGNQLPNAPHWTATVLGDYTLPLPSEWLMTLHTDVHWQSQSWWRVFNDHPYDKLHPYFTMNLAAIFTNEEQGWNIMAYIKNITDETAITGAFLNSDDTGLTTNVFLTEPRLYGLRVTKAWTGGPLLGNFGARREGPYPFTVELGGQIQRHDAPNETAIADFSDEFTGPLDTLVSSQGGDLDWGDGREVKLIYRPGSGPWLLSASWRYGETGTRGRAEGVQSTAPVCAFPDPGTCAFVANDPGFSELTHFSIDNWSRTYHYQREEQEVVDLAVGRDLAFAPLSRSVVSAGLRHATLKSQSSLQMKGVPDWVLATGFFFNMVPHTEYEANLVANRKFDGAGPVVSWDASAALWENEIGRFDVDWSIGAGALFGDRDNSTAFSQSGMTYSNFGVQIAGVAYSPYKFGTPVDLPEPIQTSRSGSATVPVLDLSLGFSYRANAFTASTGYRWERYFNAIDGGIAAEKDEDRTIDGPYLKIAVGFGG